MPELPEVETVKRGLMHAMDGRRFTRAENRRSDLRILFPVDFQSRLIGRRVKRLWRRAKYIMIDLDSGETLVIHLGMSGRITVLENDVANAPGDFHHVFPLADAGRGRHDHVVFETDAPACIVFTDHRRFGLMTIIETESIQTDKLFKDLGIEPLSAAFNAVYLKSVLKGKKTSIKSALLDQHVIAGLGNIYVCEALWRARISPRKLASRLSAAQAGLLVPAIQTVLNEAIEAGGSSLRDHRQTNGDIGYFQHRFAVYDRKGEACLRPDCSSDIRRIVQTGRSTFYCPSCQK